jgi:hypothetical protein
MLRRPQILPAEDEKPVEKLLRPEPQSDENEKVPASRAQPKEAKLVKPKDVKFVGVTRPRPPVQGEPVPVKGGTAFLPKPKPGMRALPSKDVGLGRLRKLPKDAPVEPSGGMMRTADFRDSNDDGTDDRDQRPTTLPAPSKGGGLMKKVGGLGGLFGSGGRGMGGPKNLPAPVEPSGGMRTADFRDSNDDGTDDRDQRPSAQPQKKEIKQDLRGLKNQKREMKAVGQKPGIDLKSKIADAKAKLGAAKGVEKRPATGQKPKFLSKFRSQRDTGRNVNTRAGLRNTRGLREDVVDSVFEKLRLVQAAPATDYIEEKMNMKTAEMGEVIKDFEKSDAPQFKGKSKAKRRQMAIAAKLQAERG